MSPKANVEAEPEETEDGNDWGEIDVEGLKAHSGRPGYDGSQAAIIEAALTNKVVTVLTGRNSGKTITLFLLLLEEGARHRGLYQFGYIAQGHPQAKKFYRMVKRAFADTVVAFSNEGQDRWVEVAPFGLNDGAIIHCWSGEPGALDNIRGPRLDRLAPDESGLIHKTMLPACIPMLHSGGKMIFVGTARRGGMGTTWFKEMYQRGANGEANCKSFNFPSECNPYKAVEDILFERRLFRNPAEPDVKTPEEIEEFDGAFISDFGAYFRNLDRCITLKAIRQEPGLWIFEDPEPGCPYVIGADWGRRHDHSVSAVINRRTRNMAALRIEPAGESVKFDPQMARLDALKRRYNDALVISDAVGVSAYVNERLAIQFRDRFKELGFTGSGADSKDVHCSRLRHLLDVEGIHLGDVPELRKQFENFAQVPRGEHSNGFRYEGQNGVHDDVVSACIFAANVLQIDPYQARKAAEEVTPFSPAWFAKKSAERRRIGIRRGMF